MGAYGKPDEPRIVRLARWVLERSLPNSIRDDVVGDLEEQRTSRAARGERVALWYVACAVRLSARFVLERWSERRGRRNPHDAWLVPGTVRIAARVLTSRPAWTLLAVATLGLGIGMSTTAFSIVYGALYRGLPFEAPHELVHFERLHTGEGRNLAVTPHDYEAWAATRASFEALGAFVEAALILNEDGVPERENGLYISASSFSLLRVRAAMGRVFNAEDDRPGAPPVLLLGHLAWQNRFGGDPAIVGRTLRVNGEPTTIIGVMPRGFAFPVAEQYWLPLRLDIGSVERGEGRLDVFGRLVPGATMDSGRAEIEAVSAQLAAQYPATNAEIVPQLKTMTEEYIGEDFARLVESMFAGAVFVLLIACTNVGTLLSARAAERGREMALRTALGARRSQLVAQLMTETALLCGAAGIVGILIAHAGVRWVNTSWARLGDFGLPHGPDGLFWWRFELDAMPLAFVLFATGATVLVAGLVPALRGSRDTAMSAMRQTGRGHRDRRGGASVVTFEVALTMSLLVAAALTALSVSRLSRVDYGFRVDDVTTAAIGLPETRYPDEIDERRFWTDLEGGLREHSDVQHVAVATTLPVRRARRTLVAIRGRSAERERDLPRIRTSTVNPAFFETFGVSLLAGRPFGDADRRGALPVAIVNESFVVEHFPGESPIGREIRVGAASSGEPWRTIVGVAPDLWMDGLRARETAGVYLPMLQSRSPYGVGLRYMRVALVGRGAGTEAELLRSVVSRIDAELPVYGVRSMSELVHEGTGRYETYGAFYMLLGLVALFLACLGLYGVLSTQVARSAGEIGVRMALGADRRRIVALYLKRGLRTVGLGILLGAPLSYVMAGSLRSALFDIEPGLGVFFLAAAALLASGVLASGLPARKASKVAPMAAVRNHGA